MVETPTLHEAHGHWCCVARGWQMPSTQSQHTDLVSIIRGSSMHLAHGILHVAVCMQNNCEVIFLSPAPLAITCTYTGASARAAVTRELTRRPRTEAVWAAFGAVVRGAYARSGAGPEGVTGGPIACYV